MKIFNLFKKPQRTETSQAKREREAKEALENMKNNCTSETIRVAVDKSFLANFGHMYE